MLRIAMFRLTQARLVAGTLSPAGDGTTGAERCVIEDRNGRRRMAFLKRGSPQEVISEALAALLLSGWGLSVPEPFLLVIDGALAFASADKGYPNLKQRFSISDFEGDARDAVLREAMRTVSRFGSTPKAAACDEAIDNRDRNLGNVLWDGAEEVWIDHAFCFGVGGMIEANKLCDIAIAVGEMEAVQRGALAAAMVLDRTVLAAAAEDMSSSSISADDFIAATSERLSKIGARLLARFPQPDDLLAGVANV